MEELPKPAPVVTVTNLNIANPQRRTTGDDVCPQYAAATQETKATTAPPPLVTSAPAPLRHKWLLWILFVLRCISLVLLLLVFICLIYGSTRGRHYIINYVFALIIFAYTVFAQWLTTCLLFPRGRDRVHHHPRTVQVAWASVIEVILMGMAFMAVFFPSVIDDGRRECDFRWSSDEGPGSYEAHLARQRRFACQYGTVRAVAMLAVSVAHAILMVLTFVQVCLGRRGRAHPDVALVGVQPRSGRYV